MEERNYKVYIHENKINHKKYIGITRNEPYKRWGRKGIGYKKNTYFWNAIRKHGWDNFSHEVWLINLTGNEANEMEKILIKAFKSNQKEFGYNIDKGGAYTGPTREETREKLSKLNKGKKLSEEHRRKVSEHHADVSGKNNPMYGVHPWSYGKGQPVVCLDTGIQYKNVVEAAKALGLKESNIRAVAAMAQLSTGGFHFVYKKDYNPDKWYNMNRGNNKRIVCTDTGEIFESIKECAEEFNLDTSSITKVCKNKQSHIQGYHFMYEEDYVRNPKKTNRDIISHERAVVCLNNNQRFNSTREAARNMNLDSSTITKVCKGRVRSTKGYKFMYLEDYEKQNL